MLQDRETITKRKDGRFMGRFIIDHEPNGKAVYQYVYGKSYDEAEQKLRIAREIESNYLSGRCITIKKVYGEWLNVIVNRVKESTYANYTMKFEKHILPYFGEKLCISINSATINAFIKEKVDSGLSAGYVRDLFTVFKALLAYAQEEYSFKLSLKNVSLPKAEKKKPHKMDDEQQKKLVGFIKSHIDLTGLGVLLCRFLSSNRIRSSVFLNFCISTVRSLHKYRIAVASRSALSLSSVSLHSAKCVSRISFRTPIKYEIVVTTSLVSTVNGIPPIHRGFADNCIL